jgi:hypothetical protein
MYPYNPFRGQRIQAHANEDVDRAFLAHYAIKPAAESDDGVLGATDLDAAVKSVAVGLNNPDVPRNLKVKGNASGGNNVVKIHGTNFAGEVISEDITPNGTTAVVGTLAFKTVTKVDLPVADHTEAKQKTTSAVTAATGAGAVTLTVTAAIFGTPAARDVTFTLAAGDVASTTTAATAIKNALNADPVVGAHFTVTSSTANVIMEAKVAAPQDATINLVVKTVGSTGLTIGAITVNTTTGVRDRISVGWGKSIGIPYRLPADELVILKLFDNAADSGTVTPDATDIERNVIALAGTPDGTKPADLYILV